MARTKTTFDQLIADTIDLDARLADTNREFFRPHSSLYASAARRITEKTVMAAMPPAANRPQWMRKARILADRVSDHVMLDGGYMISLAASSNISGELSEDKDARPSEQRMSHADIVNWIKAGQQGLPGGKRITSEDEAFIRKNGINAKATVVMRAYYSREPMAAYARLRRAVQRYFHGTEDADADPILDAIATAWNEYFSVVYPADLKAHVAHVVSEF